MSDPATSSTARDDAFWARVFPPRDSEELLRALRALFPPRWRFLVKLRHGRYEWDRYIVVVPARYADRHGQPGQVRVVRYAEQERAHWALWSAIRQREKAKEDLAWLAPIWPNLPTDLPWYMPWRNTGASEYDV
jgi:hypothetical protein